MCFIKRIEKQVNNYYFIGEGDKPRRHKGKAVHAKFVSLLFNGLKIKGDIFMEVVKMNPNQFFEADVAFVNKRNRPAKVDGQPTFEFRDENGDVVSDDALAIEQSGDNGQHVKVTSKDADVENPVSRNLWVKADADLENDADDSTSDDVETIEVLLGTVVIQPLSATGAALSGVTAPADVS